MANEINKLTGAPFQNISSWLYENEIKRKKDKISESKYITRGD